MSRNTLVVHTGGIGDFLLCCPAMTHLAAHAPITLLGQSARLELGVHMGIAGRAIDLDDVDFASAFAGPSATLRGLLAPFDRAVVWMRDDGALETALGECGIPEVQCFPGLPPDDWARHASEYYLDCLDAPSQPALRWSCAPADGPHDVVIHPGSGGVRKNWPVARFLEVADALAAQGRGVTWCLGPAEEQLEPLAPRAALRCGSLLELARHLAAARLYLGNDSGITHLAASVGCRVVTIFGPTDPAIWAPRGGQVCVVSGAPWPSVAEVMAGCMHGESSRKRTNS